MASHPSTRPVRPFFWPLLLASTVLCASGWKLPPAAPFASQFDVHTLAHFSVFGLLATLILRSFGPRFHRPSSLIIAFGLTALFGIGDEIRQAFNPVRVFSLADAFVNCLGAATAIAAYRFWPAYRRLLEWDILAPRQKRADPPRWKPGPEIARESLKSLARRG